MEDARSSKFQGGVAAPAVRRGSDCAGGGAPVALAYAVLRTLSFWQDDRPESGGQTGGKTLALGDVHALARLEPLRA